MTTALVGYYEGDVIRLRYKASAAPTALDAFVIYETAREPGRSYKDTVPTISSFTTDRTEVSTEGDAAGGSGHAGCNVTGGGVLVRGGASRGRLYVRFVIARQSSDYEECLCCGYVYSTRPFLSVGEHIEPGPGGGEGWLSWVSLAADIAPVDVTQVLATPNAIRRVYGFAWYYDCAAVAATRTMNASLRRPGLAVPTGFALDANVWASGTITLTTGEEGLMYVKGQHAALNVLNDNGTLVVGNITTAPVPFPYTATDNDLAELFFDIAAADATDRHSIHLLQEEWLVI